MTWFSPRLPVAADEAAWLDENVDWVTREFSASELTGPVVLPTRDSFPIERLHCEAGARAVLDIVARRMSINPAGVDFVYTPDHDAGALRFGSGVHQGVAGHYVVVDGRPVVTVFGAESAGPVTLVATLAHELAHVRLLGEGRIDPDRRDGEPLTDLLTVFLGLGIFTANAAHEFAADSSGWSARRLGYMTEQMFGYALARYAMHRDERDAAWIEYLDLNPRTYMRQTIRFLDGNR